MNPAKRELSVCPHFRERICLFVSAENVPLVSTPFFNHGYTE